MRSDSDLDLVYTRSARILPSDMDFAVFLRFDTDCGLVHTRSFRIMLPDTYFAVFLRSDTDFYCMYTRAFRILVSNTDFTFSCVLTQILVVCTHVLLAFCLRTHILLLSSVLTQISV